MPFTAASRSFHATDFFLVFLRIRVSVRVRDRVSVRVREALSYGALSYGGP